MDRKSQVLKTSVSFSTTFSDLERTKFGADLPLYVHLVATKFGTCVSRGPVMPSQGTAPKIHNFGHSLTSAPFDLQ